MAWVVDTCVLVDVFAADPKHGRASAEALRRKLSAGLVVCPVTYIELSPAFRGASALEEQFLAGVGADWRQPWSWKDTEAAHRAWNRHVARRRRQVVAKRPVADILIGAFATRFDGLITRNPGDFRPSFPGLAIAEP